MCIKMLKKIQLSAVALVLLSAAAAVSSCEKPEEQAESPVLIAVTEGDVQAPWEGGKCTFLYEVENPTATGKIDPSTTSEWITDFFTGSYGEITFTVAENQDESSRTATVVVKYEDQSLEFNVVQAGKDEMGNSYLKIDIDSLTTSSMHVTVTPADPELTYLVLSSDMESMAGFEDDALLFEDAMSYYQSMADMYQTTLEEYLASFIITGEYDDTFSGLEPDTEYCVFAFGVSADGTELLTPIARASARTKAVEEVDVTFDITVETEYTDAGSTADIVINPSDTDAKYWYLLLTQMDYDIYGAAMPDAVEGYLAYLINVWGYSGYTPEMIYDLYSVNGRQEISETLEPKSTYWISAFAWDEQCNITSEIAWVEFQAPGLESDNKISLEVKDVTATSAKFVTTVTNDDPYWIGIQPLADVAGWDDEYLMWALVDYYDIASEVVTGNQEKLFENLDPNTEYVAIAFGFDGGSWTTGLTRVDFTTSEAGDPSKCTFDFKIDNLKARSVDITVVPSDPSVSYHWDLFEADMTEEEIRTMFQENIDYQIEMGWVADALEFWQWTVVRGNNSYSWTTLTPESSYKVMAVAIDMTTGEYATDFVFHEFTTPEAVLSDATVELDLKWYDGDELYEYDPGMYAAFKDKAYTDVQASVSGPVAHYYYTVFNYSDGYEDPEVFSDEDVIYNLVDLQKGQMDRVSAQWLLNWDTEYIVIGIAVDADGNYGCSYRQKFICTRDGSSPIDEIVQSGQNASAAVTAESTAVPVVSARTLVRR